MATIAKNKKAFHDYEIVEKFEAGIELRGTEVKSIRNGNVNLKDSFVKFLSNQAYLINCHISEYSQGNIANHEPTRSRRLLMHRKEIDKLMGKMQEKGLSVVPLAMYFNGRNLIKVEIALAKGKKVHDKRRSMREKDMNREMERALKNRM
ncbi:SsrA-binding protein SmpB [Limisalsivibrio acetivorans]|uniref:SsrA-binding protein SmpB n=1 Tax=Limisalsivibrio acetivorans TaxID=1304888 RepID=UPI0003B73253|nr:SsrA-binding protein SmpB [Limisalsivibrio acetivorans]